MANFIINKTPPVGMSGYEWNKRIANAIINFAPPYCDKLFVSYEVGRILQGVEIYKYIKCRDTQYQAIINGIQIYIASEDESGQNNYSFAYSVSNKDKLSFVGGEIIGGIGG